MPDGQSVTDIALDDARVGERWVLRHRLSRRLGHRRDRLAGRRLAPTRWLLEIEGGEHGHRRPSGDRRRPTRPAARGGPDPRRTSADELEWAALPGWVALSEPLGEWTLRAGGGFTGRANSALAVGDPGVPLAEAADRVIAYARRARDRALGAGDRRVRRRGRSGRSRLAADVRGHRRAGVPARPPCSVTSCPTRGWQIDTDLTERVVATRTGAAARMTADPAILRMILDGHPPRAFASVRRPGDGGRARRHRPRSRQRPLAGDRLGLDRPRRTSAGSGDGDDASARSLGRPTGCALRLPAGGPGEHRRPRGVRAVGLRAAPQLSVSAGAGRPIDRTRSERDVGLEVCGGLDRAGSTGQGSAELDGVMLERRTATPERPAAARRAVQHQRAGPTVSDRPLANDAVDDRPVVLRRELVGTTDGAGDVDPVQPRIPGQDHVGEIADAPDLPLVARSAEGWPASPTDDAGEPLASGDSGGRSARPAGR